MSEFTKWIATCLETLKTLNVLDVDKKSSQEFLSNKLTAINSNAIGTQMRGNIFLHSSYSISDCSKRSRNIVACDLSKLEKEKKVLLEDFKFVPSDRSNPAPSKQHLTYLSLNEPKQAGFACPACYYNSRMRTLLDRLVYAPLEVNLPMDTKGGNNTFFFTGLLIERDGEKYKVLLGFEYEVSVAAGKRESKEKRYILMSNSMTDTVTYVRLTKTEDNMYIIDKRELLNTLDVDELTPIVLDMNMIYFLDHEDNEFNLGAKYNESLNNSFKLWTTDIKEILKNTRALIPKKRLSEEEEERRKKREEGRRKKEKEAKEEEEETGLFTWKNMGIVAVGCIIIVIIGYFFVKLGEDSEELS